MFNPFEYLEDYGSLTVILLSVFAIFLSGIFFGFIYYVMDILLTAFQGINCTIDNNTLVTNCQELFNLSIYPFLQLKEILIWFSFFFIFAIVLGILILGYKSGKSPALLGLLVVFLIALVYGSIELSNVYRLLLENVIFRNMMLPFTVYNKVMLYLPWFSFFVGICSLGLGIVNFQRVKVNSSQEELDY